MTICVDFIRSFSLGSLLVSQGLDRVEPRGAHRRVKPEDHADPDRDADRDDHGAARDEERQIRRLWYAMHDLGDGPSQEDPEHSAEAGERDRLDEELRQDVAAPRANGLADTDLTGPLV